MMRMAPIGIKYAVGGFRKIIYGMILAGFLVAVMNHFLGGDDDDGKSFWSKVPEFEKNNNFIFMFGKDNAKRYKFPMFSEAMIPWQAGANMANVMLEGMSWAKAAGNLAVTAIKSLPIAGTSNMGTPPVWANMWELYSNKDSLGRDIHPTPYPNSKDVGKPKSQVMFPWTDPVWQKMAEILGKIGGGDEYEKPVGALDLHPEDVRFILKEALGGVYTFTLGSAELAWRLANGVKPSEVEYKEMPFLRNYVAQGTESNTYAKFKEGRAKALEWKGAADTARQEQDQPAAQKYSKLSGAANAVLNEVRAKESPLNDEAERIRDSKVLSLDERERRLKALDLKRLQIRKEALPKFKAAGALE